MDWIIYSESLTNDAKLKRAKRDAERRTSLENKFRVDDTSSFALSPHILHTKDFTGGNLFCKIIHSRNSVGNMMKDWTQRWFSISPTNKLCVQLIDMKVNTQIIVELADLTISTVKIPSSESSYGDDSRMFRFDVISADPTNGKLLLQAGSSEERDVWIQRLRKSIAASLRTRSTSESMSDRLHRKLLEISPRCADCGATNPTWLSLNLGVSVCIVRSIFFFRFLTMNTHCHIQACSGIHRSLGVAVSKIRSLDMDSIPVTQMEIVVNLGGNDKVNSVVWESGEQRGWKKLNPDSNSDERRKYITAKYRWRGFVKIDPTKKQNELDEALISVASKGNLLETLRYIAQGADIANLSMENISDDRKLCIELVRLNKRNAVGPAAIME